MADSVIMVGWDRVYPGHEKEALEAFNSSVGFWMKQVQSGNAERASSRSSSIGTAAI
jgi:hypothetical protein